ncbi:MAG: hypothetical protein ACYCOU_13370 [Sulfobacillus sp.]
MAKPGFPFMAIDGAGSANRKTYFFNTENGIIVRCGCFKGSLEDFRERVKETHENSEHAHDYLAFADLVAAKWK